jgi:putative peptidoglycan lipid II flippase
MGLIGKFFSVGGATFASRAFGFVREMLIASLLGTGPVADAFYAAFRFPNLFRRLFAEGAFNSAFVPLFARELETGGREAAREFCEQVFSALLFVLIAFCGLAMVFMPQLVGSIIAVNFDPLSEKFALTSEFARVMFPYLAAMSLVAMLSGVLNSFRRYFLAALAPVILNVVLIAALLVAAGGGYSPGGIGRLLSWSVTLSGALQLGLLAVGVRRLGFGFSLRPPRMTPKIRRLLLLAVPAAITGGITQINLLIGQNIASGEPGAIAVMNYADRVFQLPLGVIVVAIGVVLLPELTRALAANDAGEAAKLQNRSFEFGLVLTVPAAIGFAVIPEALIALVYERGAFTRETTLIAAAVLAHFGWGLPAAALIAVFRPGFYARHDMATPMWFVGANVATNVTLSLILFPRIGVAGIAIATSIAQWLNALLLGASLWRRGLYRPSQATFRRLGLVAAANVAMAAVLSGSAYLAGAALLDGSLAIRILLVAGLILISAAVYFGLTFAFGIVERSEIASLLRARANRPPPPARNTV